MYFETSKFSTTRSLFSFKLSTIVSWTCILVLKYNKYILNPIINEIMITLVYLLLFKLAVNLFLLFIIYLIF